MKELQFVNAEQLKTLDQYAHSLFTSVISLKSIKKFHTEAFKKGILDDIEGSTGNALCGYIDKLLELHLSQLENVLQRTTITKEDLLKNLQSLMPKKRSYVKKNGVDTKKAS